MSELKNKIVTEIKKIYDPEIPVNIYELGLIYKIEINNEKKVNIEMTLTSPNCPVAESLPKMVKDNVLKIDEVSDVDLKLVWDPPWTKDKMSEGSKIRIKFMSQQVIKLSTNAAERIKEIMSKAEDKTIGVRVGVKSGGCAGMSYIMEYAKDIKPNEEIVEDKGVKVLIDPKAIMYLLGTEMDYKKEKFSSQFIFKNPNETERCGCGESFKI